MATKAKESPAELKLRAKKIYTGLNKLYPNAHCELDFKNPLQLLVATILAAQCTDKRVNMVTPALFVMISVEKFLTT
jgi:endonuclease-3